MLLAFPENDLPQASYEIQAVFSILKDLGMHVEVLSGHEFTKDHLFEALSNGNFDVFHYCGHSKYDGRVQGASHLDLSEGRKLRADELKRITRKSNLKIVYLNSCESAMAMGSYTTSVTGLADVFVQNGVPCVIGTRWSISDRGARILGKSFYENLLVDGNPANALRTSRLEVGNQFDWEDPAWAAPILYLS